MALVGYARVSTEDQVTDPQIDALKASGCGLIHREHASGARRARPELANAVRSLNRGDVLVVVRLDRLARSLSHLLDVIEQITERGAHFRSLSDPIDTTTPQGRFALQVLGAVAELERALIQERTKDGLRAAKARGRIGGNPGLRAGDPSAIQRVSVARERAYFAELNRTAEQWLPIVRQMRPDHRWEDVVRVLNAKRPAQAEILPSWTVSRLKRAVERFVREGLADKVLLQRAPTRASGDRLLTLVAGIARANPDLTLQAIGAQLEAMHERTPRGGRHWSPSSVKNLLDRAGQMGLLEQVDKVG